jgi:hypothetical protein
MSMETAQKRTSRLVIDDHYRDIFRHDGVCRPVKYIEVRIYLRSGLPASGLYPRLISSS